MSRVQLALYRGPAADWLHQVSHYAIRAWTWSRWSHAELVIDGVCWSASSRDSGVRSKVINLSSGRWDVIDLDLSDSTAVRALAWYQQHDGAGYDYLGIARFVAPFLGHSRNRWLCFESVGAALDLAAQHKLTANDLYAWAMQRANTATATA